MALQDLAERLLKWIDGLHRSLKNNWFLWPLLLVAALLEERFLSATNKSIDWFMERGMNVPSWIQSVLTDPVSFSIVAAVLIFVGLGIHAYFDTRNLQPGIAHGIEIAKANERRRAELDAMSGGAVDAILESGGFSDTEYNSFIKLKASFLALPLSEKYALKRLCEAGTMPRRDLYMRLKSDGFADPSSVVGQLEQKHFVEEMRGAVLRLREARLTDALLKDNPIV